MTDVLSITPRPSMAAGKTLLEVKNLVTEFPLRTGIFKAVNDISFSIEPGKTLCVVGESGSGKSVTARSILQIIDSPGRIASGSIILNRQDGTSVDLARLDPRSKAIRAVRGRDIAMIFQEPMSSLSPVHTVGDQITEVLRLHLNMSKAQARKEAAELLRQVEIPNPEQALDRYAFQYSGGMRQRAMIAMALACKPQLLIADEPTTALDVTTQAEILDLIKRLQQTTGMAVLFITHDMGVVAQIADDVLVMHHGVIKEYGPVDQIFHTPKDPYTKMLIGSVLKLEQKAEIRLARPPLDTSAEPILDIRNLSMHFGEMKALNDVSIALLPGETLGIVGESGSGKTTLGRSIMRLYDPASGEMHYRRADGRVVDLAKLEGRELKAARRELRMVFQDPFGSLNPRMTVAQVIGEPLLVNGLSKGKELDERVCHLMDQVGLDPAGRERYPHAFSGGQRQRIGIARAITLNPRIIVADEATSALDVSVRFQVLDLLMRLQDELKLAYIFISHDIGVIRYMCDRVGVMYRGRLVEVGEAEKVCNNPDHPYTQALISAIPRPDPRDRDRSKRFRYIEPSPHIDPSNVKNRSSAR
ncbi:Glutathione ABC transporter, ATP-binding protein GsiA [Neorhizobium galegae bv. officinalis]|uniref:Glutathione ABC transporter, ATP-binding protein GsiA n=1 Tax=Neorhizobium galegae bv. officinalis TaxID=323656 RepID=A0A0T7FBT0_NEOGA|nr:ABC transporter ATP-binding protein [Neorhizobium galegae]CDZ32494.1 Glutathione ABC transporter, ATP-binding protein GsiA [Neorhizobium galegae bv. officinalis]